MRSTRTGSVICFNGEIYNVLELRKSLALNGHEFRSTSDTEVVLAAYDEWGAECVQHLRGMFALAIWDDERRQLYMARDRLGIKPLYYTEGAAGLVFGSEVRSLLTGAAAQPKLSPKGLGSYLALGGVQDPVTIIQDVHALPAGHYGIYDASGIALREYWSLREAYEGRSVVADGPAAVSRLRSALEDALKRHLISDVPVGVFLSGGIDSSSLVALMATVGKRPPATVSLSFPQQAYSEERYIELVSRRFGTDHVQVEVSDADLLQELDGAMAAMDQPTVDGVNTYVVSKFARRAGLKVAVAGLGGDELFAGYDTFRRVPRLEALRDRLPSASSRITASFVTRVYGDSDRGRKFARWMGQREPHVTAYALQRELFAPDVQAALTGAQYGIEVDPNAAEVTDRVNAVSMMELSSYMRNVLLRDSDVMSMAHSLEIRVPFLDHVLVELVASLPGASKVQRRRAKPLLVDALDGLLPEEVARRKKMGFTMPFSHWMRDGLRVAVETTLLDKDLGGQVAGALNHDVVTAVWQDFLGGRTGWSRPWALYVAKTWGERHLPTAH
jgi:asparagine synthase (glutamine-hydrolysing)